jgi:hypothetical protein
MMALWVTAVLVMIDHLWPPAGGQPLPLRWTRVAASHPLRTALGILIPLRAFLGTLPSLAPPPKPEGATQAEPVLHPGTRPVKQPPTGHGSRFFVEVKEDLMIK